MSNKIIHSGVIKSIGVDCLYVEIMQASACADCRVAGNCHASEAKVKVVDVYCRDVARYHVGERIIVSTTSQVGLMAMLYAYLFPLMVLMTTLILVRICTRSDGWAALSALAILIPYYIVLYLFRERIKEQVHFNIEQESN